MQGCYSERLLKAFSKPEHFNRRTLFSWIYSIALNESLNLSKSKKRFDLLKMSGLRYGIRPKTPEQKRAW